MACIAGNAKHGIKSKAPSPSLLEANRPFTDAFERMLLARRRNKQNHGAKARGAPMLRNAGHCCEERSATVTVGSSLVVARRTETGFCTERIDFEAGVIGHYPKIGSLIIKSSRFDSSI